MSIEFKSKLYIEYDSYEGVLRGVIDTLQQQGWYYDPEYDGYTVNRQLDWSLETQNLDLTDLETGIQTLSSLDSGAITLSGEFHGHLLNVLISVNRRKYHSSDGMPSRRVMSVKISTPVGAITENRPLLDEFTDAIVKLAERYLVLLVYAGPKSELPADPTMAELNTKPRELAPLTYFGPAICDSIEEERLTSVPEGEVRLIGGGVLLFVCANYAAGCYPDTYETIADHLGISFV